MGMGVDCVKALSLFSGIGGIDLAGEWAGIETVAFCEREQFCQKVLKKHWPDTPLYDDICTLTKERLEADGIGTIDLIHGGYPCQPFSYAGHRKGSEDDRHLWPEYFRLVQEFRPRWVLGENVAGHISLGLDNVLYDLEGAGYTARPFVIPAAAVGAPHRRERVFIVAYTSIESSNVSETNPQNGSTQTFELGGMGIEADVSDSAGEQSPSKNERKFGQEIQKQFGRRLVQDVPRAPWEVSEPPVCGVDDGFFTGLDKDRLKALGNAVVPQQIYPILAAIKQIDAQWRANA